MDISALVEQYRFVQSLGIKCWCPSDKADYGRNGNGVNRPDTDTATQYKGAAIVLVCILLIFLKLLPINPF